MLGRICVGIAAVALGCAASATARAPVPTPIGVGIRFHPPSLSAAVAAARPIGRLRCREITRIERAHVEVFARRRVVIVPAAIGFSARHTCSYPTRTTAPTGVVEFDRSQKLTLGDFFAVWGQPLSRTRLVGFVGRVRAYVAGRPWRRPLRTIPLRRHAEIVLEIGGYVPPHAIFLFGRGR